MVIGLLVGVRRLVNSVSNNVATFPPLPPALQILLYQWIHTGVVNTGSVAADCPGESRKRVANLQGSEHPWVVLIRAGRREYAALTYKAFIAAAAAAAILVAAEEVVIAGIKVRRPNCRQGR